MNAPKITLLSPGGRNAFGTSTKSKIVPARQTTQITGEIHRCRRNHQSDPPYKASTRFSMPPITRSIQVFFAPSPRGFNSRAHISGVSVSDTRPEAKIAITIVIAIFASGLVSLTLTPLMCARLLKPRGEGAKKTWMERVIGGIEKRVLALYGGSLWWFLRHRWISPVIWVVCLAGTILLFVLVPKAFLPPGDSSVIFGAFIAREGSSPG